MASENSQEKKANWAWSQLFDKYHIQEEIQRNGEYRIFSEQIKEFREPRLMAKWDSEASLPEILKKNRVNILPINRREYVLSDFKLYEPLPPFFEQTAPMKQVHFKEQYESVDCQHISSESNAINVLLLSDVLDDFLDSQGTAETFNGRMGTGAFDFFVNSYAGVKRKVSVEGAQCEIDGGFENDENVIIMEAKNVIHSDFHVRQLYYPYRLWKSKVKKPIRLLFSQYTNQIFRLFEYAFANPEDYSSIYLVQQKNYSLEDIHITKEELIEVWEKTSVCTDDHMVSPKPASYTPFIQADSLERVISLLEHLAIYPMDTEEIAQLMNFKERQSDYYYHAGHYLGLFIKKTGKRVYLTSLGWEVYRLPYKKRQLKLVSLILQHQIFHDFFAYVIDKKQMPTKKEVVEKMLVYHVCSEDTAKRRASSVLDWLRWIFHLLQIE